jgi:hippurate hydrolase
MRAASAPSSAVIEKQMRGIAEGTGRRYDVAVEWNYTREFVPLLDDPFWSTKPCRGPHSV